MSDLKEGLERDTFHQKQDAQRTIPMTNKSERVFRKYYTNPIVFRPRNRWGGEVISALSVEAIANALPAKFKMSEVKGAFMRLGSPNSDRAADKLLQRMRRDGFIFYADGFWIRNYEAQA